MYSLAFFSTFEELKLPIKGPLEDAGVIKLYEPSLTKCLFVAPAESMVGRVPLIQLFLAGNSTPTIPLTCSASARFQASRLDAPLQQLQTEAMSMRSTRGCGSLGLADIAA